MHTLVQMLYLARKEFERNLVGLTDEDARKRIEPMNCISWIIAHVANQHHLFSWTGLKAKIPTPDTHLTVMALRPHSRL